VNVSGGWVTRAAITEAANRLGHGDPVAVVDELTMVDVGGLRTWHELTSTVRGSLSDGVERLGHVLPTLAGAWSSPAPREAVERHRSAGLAAGDVVGRQIDAVLDTVGTLESTRTSARSEMSRTEHSVLATGWPPGEDLLTWASGHGQLPAVTAAVDGLAAAVRRLRTRNDAALQALASALRADPAEPVESLRATMPAAFPGVVTPNAPTAAEPAAIDRANLDRLAADLRSTDVSVLIAARGVQAALDKARAGGGRAQLVVYESASATSQGRAAISVGDITGADNVVTMAPGVSSSPATMSDGIDGALAMRDRSERLDPSSRTAVVAWYGYDVPLAAFGGSPMLPGDTLENSVAAVNDLHARAGGQQLVEDLATFRQWAPDDARFIGVGFSMGSTTVSAAAARGAGFDDLVLLGSPGASVEVDSAADYPGLSTDHVWVVGHDRDPVTTGVTDELTGMLFGGLGLNLLQPTPFGPDPADADFGARVVDVPSNAPDISVQIGGPIGAIAGAVANEVTDLRLHHREDNYLSGASLDAVSSIVVGRYGDVPLRPGR
jgi:hypothetical protein